MARQTTLDMHFVSSKAVIKCIFTKLCSIDLAKIFSSNIEDIYWGVSDGIPHNRKTDSQSCQNSRQKNKGNRGIYLKSFVLLSRLEIWAFKTSRGSISSCRAALRISANSSWDLLSWVSSDLRFRNLSELLGWIGETRDNARGPALGQSGDSSNWVLNPPKVGVWKRGFWKPCGVWNMLAPTNTIISMMQEMPTPLRRSHYGQEYQKYFWSIVKP